MLFTTHAACRLGRADHPENPEIRDRADFARQATIDAFGHHARALDQGDFIDRKPAYCQILPATGNFTLN